MRFSNVTYISNPRRLLCSTYIYELIDAEASFGRKIPNSYSPKSVEYSIYSTEVNRDDYTKHWLDSLTAMKKE